MGVPRPAAGGEPCHPGGGVARWRYRAVVVSVLVALIGGSALGPARGGAQAAAIVAADQVNLRVEPGTGAAVIGVLALWQPVTVLGGPTEDGWYQIQSGGLSGWSYGGFLE